VPSSLTGTRLARATDSSMLAKSSGLAMKTRTTHTHVATAESITACAADSPKMVPNSTFTPEVALVPAAEVV